MRLRKCAEPPGGLEPPTPRLKVPCSAKLSYGGVLFFRARGSFFESSWGFLTGHGAVNNLSAFVGTSGVHTPQTRARHMPSPVFFSPQIPQARKRGPGARLSRWACSACRVLARCSFCLSSGSADSRGGGRRRVHVSSALLPPPARQRALWWRLFFAAFADARGALPAWRRQIGRHSRGTPSSAGSTPSSRRSTVRRKGQAGRSDAVAQAPSRSPSLG